MKFKVEHLGPLRSAEIDLSKRLNIFCGHNSTGKTYLSYLIYGMINAVEDCLFDYSVKKESAITNKLKEKDCISYTIDVKSIYKFLSKGLSEEIKDSFTSLYGISRSLSREMFKDTKIQLETEEEYTERVKHSTFVENSFGFEITKKAGELVCNLKGSERFFEKKLPHFVISKIISRTIFAPISNVYILPVERNSIYTFSKELSIRKQEAVDSFHEAMNRDSRKRRDMEELIERRTTRYPLPIRNGLRNAEDLLEISKEPGDYFSFAEAIENELLYGKITVGTYGELLFTYEKDKTIPIQMTFSIIKSMAGLVVYLKYIAKANDLIIIDEPELNLHPDNQLVLIRIFARLLNKGFRLLISTHSDYIIREINNLIMLSVDTEEMQALKKEKPFKDIYTKDMEIKPTDLGVLYFDFTKDSTKKSTKIKAENIRKVNTTTLTVTDTGFEVPSIDETIENQNDIGSNLFDTIDSNR